MDNDIEPGLSIVEINNERNWHQFTMFQTSLTSNI